MKIKDLYNSGEVKDVTFLSIEIFFRYEATKYKGRWMSYNPDKPCYQICGRGYDSPIPAIIRTFDPEQGPFTLQEVQEEFLRLQKLCKEEFRLNYELGVLEREVGEREAGLHEKGMEERDSLILKLRKQIDEVNRKVYSTEKMKLKKALR